MGQEIRKIITSWSSERPFEVTLGVLCPVLASPVEEKDGHSEASVRCRATHTVAELEYFSCKERLRELEQLTWEKERAPGYLFKVH